jgi:hypothetical protein
VANTVIEEILESMGAGLGLGTLEEPGSLLFSQPSTDHWVQENKKSLVGVI